MKFKMFRETSAFPKMIFSLIAFFGFLLLYVHFVLQTSLFITEKLLSHQKEDLTSLTQDKSTNQESKIRGTFAVHEWDHHCRGSLRTMFKSTVFPKYPDNLHFVNKSLINSRSQNSGRRVSGYVHVPETGYYKFLLNSRGESELWVSESERHKDMELVSSVESESIDNKATLSREITHYSKQKFMDETMSYPIEIFHFGDFLDVRWIQPGKHEFEILADSHISYDTKSLSHEGLSSSFYEDKTEDVNDKTVFKFFLIAFITQWVRNAAIPECSFDLKNEITTREGSDLKTNIEVMYSDQHGKEMQVWKENPDVKQLIAFYMEGLEKIYPKRYKPKRVYKVEKLPLLIDHKPLYLMEIELEADGLDYTERVIEYIYKRNTSHYCYPKDLTWNREAHINIVVVVNNETKWLPLFIDRLENAFEQALEVDMHLIIVEFNRKGLDIKGMLEKTSLKDRFTVTNMEGPYSKSRGLNKGASLAKGNQPIILACDVHVDIPDTIFEDARTHCIEGRLAFAPVVLQLDCSSHPGTQNPIGSWCLHGYDVIGIFKTDWVKISGMDETLFEQKGDWDLIDRMRNSGISIARLKYPGLYRYYIPPKNDSLETIDKIDIDSGYLQKDV